MTEKQKQYAQDIVNNVGGHYKGGSKTWPASRIASWLTRGWAFMGKQTAEQHQEELKDIIAYVDSLRNK